MIQGAPAFRVFLQSPAPKGMGRRKGPTEEGPSLNLPKGVPRVKDVGPRRCARSRAETSEGGRARVRGGGPRPGPARALRRRERPRPAPAREGRPKGGRRQGQESARSRPRSAQVAVVAAPSSRALGRARRAAAGRHVSARAAVASVTEPRQWGAPRRRRRRRLTARPPVPGPARVRSRTPGLRGGRAPRRGGGPALLVGR